MRKLVSSLLILLFVLGIFVANGNSKERILTNGLKVSPGALHQGAPSFDKAKIRPINKNLEPAKGPVRLNPGRDAESTLGYADEQNIAYYWSIPNSDGNVWFYTRFTPEFAPCLLVGFQVILYDMEGNAGSPGIQVGVSLDDGTGLPSTSPVMDIFQVPNAALKICPGDALEYSEIRFADYSDTSIVLNQIEDFYVIVNMQWEAAEGDTVALLSDDASTQPTDRSGFMYDDGNGGAFMTLMDAYGGGYNLLIRAIVDDDPQGGGGPAGKFTVKPDSLKFGSVNVNANKSLDMTFTNNTEAAVTILDITIDGANPDYFQTDFAQEIVVQPGGAELSSVVFEPLEGGNFTATALITTDEAANNQYSIVLTGAGVAPAITVTPADTLKFGSVKVGSNKALNVTIKNTGNATLTVANAQIDGAAFTSDWAGQKDLAAGASMAVKVTYTPVAAGEVKGSLTISSNDPNKGRITLVLTGTGTGAKLDTDPDSLNFGGVAVGGSKTLPVVLKNVGTADLTISSVNIASDVYYSDFARATTLQANQTLQVNVSFEPTDGNRANATMVITSNDPTTPQLNFKLTGIGASPEADYSPDTLAFGKLQLNASKQLTVSVFSVGVSDLTVSKVVSDNAMFTTDFAASSMVAPGTQLDVVVTFKPTQAGEAKGALTITTDDPAHQSIKVVLSGFGGAPTITINKNALHFGQIEVGKNSKQVFTISNTGSADLTVQNIKANGVGFTTDFAASFSLIANATKDINVTFAPAEEGMYIGSVMIISDDPDKDTVNVSVDGFGKAAQAVGGFDFTIPTAYSMKGAYPNPFNAVTTITYGLPVDGVATVSIYDMSGHLVSQLASGKHTAGWHTAVWDGQNSPAGVYLVRMNADGYNSISKIVLVK